MSRLIDADALKEEICKEYRHFSQRIAISPVFEAIKKAPTLNSFDVVRCKDCVYSSGFAAFACPMVREVNLKDNDFCSRGERRADDN